MRQLPELHTKFIEVGKEWPENSTFAHFGHTLEDRVLAHMESFISVKFGPSQFSLHIDGLLVNGAGATNDAGFKKRTAGPRARHDWLHMGFGYKDHFTWLEMATRCLSFGDSTLFLFQMQETCLSSCR